jgi:hypothetical protein
MIAITSPLPIGVESKPTAIAPSTIIRWIIDGDANRNGVLQVNHNHQPNPIFPLGGLSHVRDESAPGIDARHLQLKHGQTYEIKIWIPGTMVNTSTWVKY